MKVVSIDIETTGMDYNNCQVLEFGAIIDDLEVVIPSRELPTFRRVIRPPDGIVIGEPYALWMNAGLLKEICDSKDVINRSALGYEFEDWLESNGIDSKRVIPAGKNFASFDMQFLNRMSGFNDFVRFKHRVLDPSILFMEVNDGEPPSIKLCAERAGLDIATYGTHTALEDARLVIDLLRIGLRKLDSRVKNIDPVF